MTFMYSFRKWAFFFHFPDISTRSSMLLFLFTIFNTQRAGLFFFHLPLFHQKNTEFFFFYFRSLGSIKWRLWILKPEVAVDDVILCLGNVIAFCLQTRKEDWILVKNQKFEHKTLNIFQSCRSSLQVRITRNLPVNI